MVLPASCMPAKDGVREIVLPCGKFARIRPILVEDIACTLGYEGYMKILAIAVRVTQLDGEPLQAESLLAMKVTDGNPIIEAVAKMMLEGSASKGVA